MENTKEDEEIIDSDNNEYKDKSENTEDDDI
jgi:hypothetical protein